MVRFRMTHLSVQSNALLRHNSQQTLGFCRNDRNRWDENICLRSCLECLIPVRWHPCHHLVVLNLNMGTFPSCSVDFFFFNLCLKNNSGTVNKILLHKISKKTQLLFWKYIRRVYSVSDVFYLVFKQVLVNDIPSTIVLKYCESFCC